MAVASFGGPLALAALYAPAAVSGAPAAAGLALVASVVVFGFPLLIWLRYSREIQSSGGLYAFTEAAAGRPVALVQAGLWTLSYLLYLLYTTAQIVYDTLPVVLPGVARYRPLLDVVIPAALTAVLLAGRRATLLLLGILAAGQLAIAAALAAVTLAHLDTPLSSFGVSAPVGGVASATSLAALLYICGSLPFFLGGEVGTAQEAGPGSRQPARTIRRGLLAAYLATALVTVAAVAPLASEPVFLKLPIPGMFVAQAYAGRGLGVTVGAGVAASIGGVIAVEYLALSRLVTAVTAWPRRRVVAGIGAAMVAFAPVTLVNPDRIYGDLLTPSLVALWLSQLIVFAAYPRFAARQRRARASEPPNAQLPGARLPDAQPPAARGHGRLIRVLDHPLPAWTLAAASAALAGYGAYTAITQAGT